MDSALWVARASGWSASGSSSPGLQSICSPASDGGRDPIDPAARRDAGQPRATRRRRARRVSGRRLRPTASPHRRIWIALLAGAPLALRAEVPRAGAKVLRLQAALVAPDGTSCVQVSAVALRTTPALPEALGDLEPAPSPPEASAPFEFPFFVDPVGYHSAVEVRIARGTWGKGPVAAWMRPRVPLVAGEVPSPLQRLLVAADSASGLAVVLDHTRYTFVNADLTVAVHRPLEGEWLCLDAATVAEAHGIGLTRARLWDGHGPLGVSLQTCLVERRPG